MFEDLDLSAEGIANLQSQYPSEFERLGKIQGYYNDTSFTAALLGRYGIENIMAPSREEIMGYYETYISAQLAQGADLDLDILNAGSGYQITGIARDDVTGLNPNSLDDFLKIHAGMYSDGRLEDLFQQIQAKPYSDQLLTVGQESFHLGTTPLIRPDGTAQFRNAKGRFGRTFNTSRLESQMGSLLKVILVDNYQRENINVVSGTLMRSIIDGDTHASMSTSGLDITFTIANIRRPRREGNKGDAEKNPPDTWTYAPLVFFGSAPRQTMPPQYMTFYSSGDASWKRMSIVRGSDPKNIFNLDESQYGRIGDVLARDATVDINLDPSK